MKHIEVSDGRKTISLMIIRADSIRDGAVLLEESIGSASK
jgi:hypothetical protein